MTASSYVWTPEHLAHYPLITALDVCSDGSRIAFALREPVLTDEESKYVEHLYRLDSAGGKVLRLTYGTCTNTAPKWSPDGQYLAFISDREGGKRNVWVLCAEGGEAWRLTRTEKGVTSFAWAPDGQRLAIVAAPDDDEARKKARQSKNDPIVVDEDFERAALWVLPLVAGDQAVPEPKRLSAADQHVVAFDWAPDGRQIALTYQPTPRADDWVETRLGVVETLADAPAVRELGCVGTNLCAPRMLGDGVVCPTGTQPISWADSARLMLYPLDGSAPRPLAETPDARPFVVGASPNGQQVYVLEASGVSSAILALPVDGGAPQTLIEGQGFLSLVCADKQGKLALVAQDVDMPNTLATLAPGDSTWRTLWQPELPSAPETRTLRWLGRNALEIEGLLTVPVSYEAGRAYPTVVMVHGGPASYFSRTYVAAPALYPVASYAERGYAVLRVNPRGSGGYGAAFRTANRHDWGGADMDDILRGVDLIIAQGIADPDRLGILGWSYGGYMTSWVITQTDRFKAASVGAGVTNLLSFTGTSDITGFLPDYFGAEFWEEQGLYQAHSAVFQARAVRTPTLIQHGDSDVRVPLSQGQELYNVLRRQGTPVQMVIYPRQPHGPTEPRLVMDIVQRNLDWFDRWLKGEAAAQEG
jgi:dipeptidyl aminopeptidase/acylaminoacyl peptidase